MNAKQLSEMARRLMMDNMASSHLEQYMIAHVNVLITELFFENNALRNARHKGPLLEIPIISDDDEEIIYEPEMLYNVMPKGLAARYLQDEDDRSKYTMLQTEYINARTQIMPVVFEAHVL
jgi:inosine/xanthosine triphosphate pyrophosphatase family protein